MQRGTIWSIAAAGGIAAFSWSLARVPPPPTERTLYQRPRDVPGLTRWVAENPTDVSGWFDLAQLHFQAGDEDAARAAWEAVLHNGFPPTSDEPRTWFMLAWAADRLGDPHAEQCWSRAAELYESHIDNPRMRERWLFWDRLAWSRSRTGNQAGAADARKLAADLLEQDPQTATDASLRLQLAREHALLGRAGDALDDLDFIADQIDARALRLDVALQSLQAEPRFQSLLARAALRARLNRGA